MQLRPYYRAQDASIKEIAEAKSKRLPDISTSLSVSYIGDGFTTDRNFSDYQNAPNPHLGTGLAINIFQPIFTGGGISGQIALAEQKSMGTRYLIEMNRDQLRFRLTGYYLDIFKYRNLEAVVKSNLEAARKVLSQMEAKYSQGVALRNDITHYELLVSDLELNLSSIRNTLSILNENLVKTAGLPEGMTVLPDSTILSRSLPAESAESMIREADIHSPSISMAKNAIEISRTSERLARSETVPQIGLQAGWSINGPILIEVPPINRNYSYWYLGLGVSYNLSSLFKSNKTIARAKAETFTSKERLDATREEIELAIKSDHIRYLEAFTTLNSRKKAVELASSNYDIVATRFEADMALLTDLFDAANAKLDAQRQLEDAKINIIFYYYKLLFITGRI